MNELKTIWMDREEYKNTFQFVVRRNVNTNCCERKMEEVKLKYHSRVTYARVCPYCRKVYFPYTFYAYWIAYSSDKDIVIKDNIFEKKCEKVREYQRIKNFKEYVRIDKSCTIYLNYEDFMMKNADKILHKKRQLIRSSQKGKKGKFVYITFVLDSKDIFINCYDFEEIYEEYEMCVRKEDVKLVEKMKTKAKHLEDNKKQAEYYGEAQQHSKGEYYPRSPKDERYKRKRTFFS